jgi:hypothetical protein
MRRDTLIVIVSTLCVTWVAGAARGRRVVPGGAATRPIPNRKLDP